jgi:hypothetical protein
LTRGFDGDACCLPANGLDEGNAAIVDVVIARSGRRVGVTKVRDLRESKVRVRQSVARGCTAFFASIPV